MPVCAPGTPMALGRGGEEPAEAFCSTLATGGDSAARGSCGGWGAPLEALWALLATVENLCQRSGWWQLLNPCLYP